MNKINKKNIILILIIIIVVISAYIIFIRNNEFENIEKINEYIIENKILGNNVENEEVINNKVENKIIVYITGAIKNEGIYELNENSRMADIIEKAGGLNEDADISELNLAYILEDGMKIYIPKKNEKINNVKDNTNLYISDEENKNISENKSTTKNLTEKININKATQTELESLPGIGPSTALSIIKYRKENGNFKKIEDIKNVSRNRWKQISKN